MSKTGRNDPCPCGSGKKFKRCCADKSSVDSSIITDDDRANAYDVLDRLARSSRFAADRAMAEEIVTPAGDMPGPLDNPEDELALSRFLDWFAFDVVLASGRALADVALIERSGDLTPGARRLIAELRAAPCRLLRVQGIIGHGAAVRFRDLVEPDRQFRVLDSWIEFSRHDVVVARLVERQGSFAIEGDPAVLFFDNKRRAVRLMQRVRRKLALIGTPPAVRRMLEGAALLRMIAASEALLDDELYTAEGDPVQPTTLTFDVHDWKALRQSIAEASDFEPEVPGAGAPTTSYRLMNPDPQDRYPLARVSGSAPGPLHIDAFSPARAEKARIRLMELAGGAISFKAVESPEFLPAPRQPDSRLAPPQGRLEFE